MFPPNESIIRRHGVEVDVWKNHVLEPLHRDKSRHCYSTVHAVIPTRGGRSMPVSVVGWQPAADPAQSTGVPIAKKKWFDSVRWRTTKETNVGYKTSTHNNHDNQMRQTDKQIAFVGGAMPSHWAELLIVFLLLGVLAAAAGERACASSSRMTIIWTLQLVLKPDSFFQWVNNREAWRLHSSPNLCCGCRSTRTWKPLPQQNIPKEYQPPS